MMCHSLILLLIFLLNVFSLLTSNMAAVKVYRKLKGVLLDLSGTLHIEDTPTPRAVETLQR